MSIVPNHHVGIFQFRLQARLALSLAILWFAAGPKSANGAELLYVSGTNGPILRYDISLGTGAAVEATRNTFIASAGTDPRGMAFDSAGNIYVPDAFNGRINRWNSSGTLIAPTPWVTGVNNGQALAFDSSGNLFVAANGSNSIARITPAGVRSTFASTNLPVGLVFDTSGNLFVANNFADTITRITPGGVTSVFANLPANTNPANLAFDSFGNLYSANYSAGTISRYDSAGVATTFASGLSGPFGLAIDSANNVYVGNFQANTISKFNSGGTLQFSWSTGAQPPRFLAFVPEPSTYVLAGLATGILALLARRRKPATRQG
jgi:sugar lactone lactonase YvrE